MRALALCEPPAPLFAAAALALLALAAHAIFVGGRGGTLALDEDGRWHAEGFGRGPFSGTLAAAGYRGAGLVVLVLVGERRRSPAWLPSPRRHVAVHVDSVPAEAFSWLHLRLRLAAGAR